jgi:hypothetical protein
VGVRHPILSPADWRGITFGTYLSKAQQAAISGLGAKPGPGFATARDQALARGALQAFDLNLLIYKDLNKEQAAPYITANVNLWPRTLALFANPSRLARLTASQRRVLDQAAADTAARSTGLVQDEAPVVSDICRTGGRFADASAADLQALRSRVAPVYASLEADPQTKAMIGQITALKRSTPAGPALTIPAGCTGQAPQAQPTGAAATAKLNGTYRWTITARDGTTTTPDINSQVVYPSIFTVTLRDGIYKMSHTGADTATDSSGDRYTVQGNRIMLYWATQTTHAPDTFTYSVDSQGALHLTPVQPIDPADAFVLATHPWMKIG